MYWTLDKTNNIPGLFKNRKKLKEAFGDRITTTNLNYHFSKCKKVQAVISDIWIVRFII